jgi:fructose-bisphosphate aldolase/2-amino-3,7-dideoxy-D-threo-hept-6-ulosonate synthase
MKGKQLRLRRLFSEGRCVILPMDHPTFFGPIQGVHDPVALAKDVAATPADGLLLTLATLSRVADVIGSLGTIARLDGTATRLGQQITRTEMISSVEMAVAAGADACILNVYMGAPNEDELLRKLGETAEACEKWGLPLFAETIPFAALLPHIDPNAKKLAEGELAEQVALAARVGAELGCDVIKTSYTGSAASFRTVVEGATVPVVIAGGPCGDSVEELLQMVEDGMKAGAAGVVIGRNIWQRENRRDVLTALCGIVHGGRAAQAEAERFRK